MNKLPKVIHIHWKLCSKQRGWIKSTGISKYILNKETDRYERQDKEVKEFEWLSYSNCMNVWKSHTTHCCFIIESLPEEQRNKVLSIYKKENPDG